MPSTPSPQQPHVTITAFDDKPSRQPPKQPPKTRRRKTKPKGKFEIRHGNFVLFGVTGEVATGF